MNALAIIITLSSPQRLTVLHNGCALQNKTICFHNTVSSSRLHNKMTHILMTLQYGIRHDILANPSTRCAKLKLCIV